MTTSLVLNAVLLVMVIVWRATALDAVHTTEACLDVSERAAARMLDLIEFEEKVHPAVWDAASP